jgi:hypothetical protein
MKNGRQAAVSSGAFDESAMGFTAAHLLPPQLGFDALSGDLRYRRPSQALAWATASPVDAPMTSSAGKIRTA